MLLVVAVVIFLFMTAIVEIHINERSDKVFMKATNVVVFQLHLVFHNCDFVRTLVNVSVIIFTLFWYCVNGPKNYFM